MYICLESAFATYKQDFCSVLCDLILLLIFFVLHAADSSAGTV